jgi:hypothetical protein
MGCDAMFAASIFQCKAHVSRWPLVNGGDQYLMAATAESAARRVAEAIARIGYDIQGILPHGVALLHAAPRLTSITPAAVVVLELAGGMVAVGNETGCGLSRHLPACSRSARELPLLEEIEPWLGEVASEVQATLRYASRLSGPHDSQRPILVCGRAAQVPGIDASLASLLGRPVAVWRYAGRTRPDRLASILAPNQAEATPNQAEATLAVSLSLACCGLQSLAGAGRPT